MRIHKAPVTALSCVRSLFVALSAVSLFGCPPEIVTLPADASTDSASTDSTSIDATASGGDAAGPTGQITVALDSGSPADGALSDGTGMAGDATAPDGEGGVEDGQPSDAAPGPDGVVSADDGAVSPDSAELDTMDDAGPSPDGDSPDGLAPDTGPPDTAAAPDTALSPDVQDPADIAPPFDAGPAVDSGPIECLSDTDCPHGPCDVAVCDVGTCVVSPAPPGQPCDDGDACTAADNCAADGCHGTPLDCADSDPCTADSCSQGSCQHMAQPGCCASAAACSDGDACNGQEICVANACLPGVPLSCKDSDPCTADSCVAGACQHTAIAGCCQSLAECDDQNPCNGVEVCINNQCTAGTPLNCDDFNNCTADSCQLAICGPSQNPYLCNCVHTPLPGCCNQDSQCDDGVMCNGQETCVAGQCQAGVPPTCADGDICTVDTCVNTSCIHTPSPGCCTSDAQCDDNQPCNGSEKCINNSCKPGLPLNCSDGDSCTTDTCFGQQVCFGPSTPYSCYCQHEPKPGCCTNNADCDDGLSCNGQEICALGACKAGTPTNCNDNNPCTVDSCDNAQACFAPPTPDCKCKHTQSASCGTLPIYRFGWINGSGNADIMYSASPSGGDAGYIAHGVFFHLFKTKAFSSWIPLYQSYAGDPLFDHLQGFDATEGQPTYAGHTLLGYCAPTQQAYATHRLNRYYSKTQQNHALGSPENANDVQFLSQYGYVLEGSCWVPSVCTGNCL